MEGGQGSGESPSSVLDGLLAAAADAADRRSADELEGAYLSALSWVAAHPELGVDPTDLTMDRVEHLLRLHLPTRAVAAASTHLQQLHPGPAAGLLLLRRAEAYAVLGDWAACARDLARADDSWGVGQGPDGVERLARDRLGALLRVQHGDVPGATAALRAVRAAFAERADAAGVRTVTRDLQRIAVDEGGPLGELDAADAGGPDEVVLAARHLRRQGRYEAAATLLRGLLATDLDPGLQFPVLHDLALLLRLLSADRELAALMPALEAAARCSAVPDAATAACRRLRGDVDLSDVDGSPALEAALVQARGLIRLGAFTEAGQVLRRQEASGPTGRRQAYLHLVTGELLLNEALSGGSASRARAAAARLRAAADQAAELSLPEVETTALWHLGHAARLSGGGLLAARPYWSQAQRREEQTAALQDSDEVRVRYLRAASTEFDEMVAVAYHRFERGSLGEAAGLVATMEAARGSAMLPAILPEHADAVRALSPEDSTASWDWLRRLAASLSRGSALWIMHAGPSFLYHAVCTGQSVAVLRVPVDRVELEGLVDELADTWLDDLAVEAAVGAADDPMRAGLTRLAELIDVRGALEPLASHVHRLAVVAGGALADVPLCALPLSTGPPLLTRFALSDLPCLSAARPLHLRSRETRGLRALQVQPGSVRGSRRAAAVRAQRLTGDRATVQGVADALRDARQAVVRFDCHGQSAIDSRESWLSLRPSAGHDGRLLARDLERMALRRTGTLVLGACETGMAERVGRDERVGLVRAGLLAGAASVVAARWAAEDRAASAILDEFERGLRWLPRDVALRRAQLQVVGGRSSARDLVEPDHPARWACWGLYGDRGYQTRTPSSLRWLSRVTS